MSITTTTDRRPELGALLRQLREQAGVSRQEAADLLGCTSSKIGDLELARSNPKVTETAALLVKYRVPADKRAWILSHVRQLQGRRPPGTNSPVGPPSRLRRVVELEGQAVVACYYSAEVIPPLLQVPGYAEALIATTEQDETRMKNLADYQGARKQFLDNPTGRPPLRYRCFLGEAALHTDIGGESTMLEQLAHLHDLSTRLPNLELRLVPFGTSTHALLGHTITLYYFRKPALPQLISEAPGYRFTRHHTESTRHAITAFRQLTTTALSIAETADHLACRTNAVAAPRR